MDGRAQWGAVTALTLGVFGLVTAEFLPASLLTPMAADLKVGEGVAGQAVTATAVVALATSLLISAATRRIDRRVVLLGFSILLVASNLIVAFAPSLGFLIVGRVFLGAALGGFWTMSPATIMRLVPASLVPRAFSVLFSGVSAATILAAPIGSYLGEILGWRAVFLIAAGLGAIAFVAQAATFPSLAANGQARLRTLAEVLGRPGIGIAMVAILLVFAGHFALFTYIRPFLETVTNVPIAAISAILLGFGIANFVGTLLAGPMLEHRMRPTLIVMPALMGLAALGLVALGSGPAASTVLVAIWGLAFGAVPVGWSTWLTRTVPDQAETAGGLLVAAIQLAIAIGAAAGGAVFEWRDAAAVFAAGGIVLLLAALLIVAVVRNRPVAVAA